VLDRGDIDSALRQIEIDAAKHLDAGDDLTDEVGKPGGRIVMVLEHDAEHAALACHPGSLDRVERSRSIVG
jgi:hypothetical protein